MKSGPNNRSAHHISERGQSAENDAVDKIPRELGQQRNLTLDDRERLAYISGDTKALALFLGFHENRAADHILTGLDPKINLTLDESERLAYISGDTIALALLLQIEEASLDVILGGTLDGSLERERPLGDVEWLLVASGYWSQGIYHGGHIAYYLAKTSPGQWVLGSIEGDAEKDDAFRDDMEVEHIDDDQPGEPLESTSSESDSSMKIVAVCSNASLDAKPEEIATELYRLVCNSGGREIDEPDDVDGLLDP